MNDQIEIPELPHPLSYYQYELVGILVHSGTAEVGHYYSYIKDRTKPSNQWFLFDDKNVKPWNLKVIKRKREKEKKRNMIDRDEIYSLLSHC